MTTAEFFAGRRDTADVEAALRIVRRAGGQAPDADDMLTPASNETRDVNGPGYGALATAFDAVASSAT